MTLSKYTTTLRHIIDIYGYDKVKNWFCEYDLTDYLTNAEIEVIETRGTWTKDKLARMIIDRYFMREIGFETPYLFKHYVGASMREVMGKYLPLIYSESIKYDPLINVDYKEIYERDVNANSSTQDSSTSNASGLSVVSDTPQGQIDKASILNGRFASNTNASESEGSSSGESSGESSSKESSTKHVVGNSGVTASAQAMIKQYRDLIRNINVEIVDSLNDLFMGLW